MAPVFAPVVLTIWASRVRQGWETLTEWQGAHCPTGTAAKMKGFLCYALFFKLSWGPTVGPKCEPGRAARLKNGSVAGLRLLTGDR